LFVVVVVAVAYWRWNWWWWWWWYQCNPALSFYKKENSVNGKTNRVGEVIVKVKRREEKKDWVSCLKKRGKNKKSGKERSDKKNHSVLKGRLFIEQPPLRLALQTVMPLLLSQSIK
jgi:hypothetical protein